MTPGLSAITMTSMTIPVDEISERARQSRPGNAALTAAAIPGVVIGWTVGRILLILGWTRAGSGGFSRSWLRQSATGSGWARGCPPPGRKPNRKNNRLRSNSR